MSIIRRSSPFGELLTLRQAMDRWFDDAFVRPPGMQQAGQEQALPLDIYATSDALVVEAALPGVRPEDVDITVHGDTLSISGTLQHEERSEEQGYLYQEVRRGTFSRTVTLPADLKTEAATASFEHGMLRLSIPRAEEAKPRQIRIAGTSEGSARAVGSAQSVGGNQVPASAGSGSTGSAGGSSAPASGQGQQSGAASGSRSVFGGPEQRGGERADKA